MTAWSRPFASLGVAGDNQPARGILNEPVRNNHSLDLLGAGREIVIDIRTIEPQRLRPTLERVLAPLTGPPRASAQHVRSFEDYLTKGMVRWQAFEGIVDKRVRSVSFLLLLPGRAGVLMFPPPDSADIDAAAQQQTVAAALEAARGERLHFVQVLVEPQALATGQLLRTLGFERLTLLIYLERDARYPWVDPPSPDEVSWVRFGEETASQFGETMRASYENSLDCPELTALRPVEDVLASHRASGSYDPALWELARVESATVGCLLLASQFDGAVLEVVYMGVACKARGRGVGGLLLRRALDQCRQRGAQHLTLVVDERNAPARALYDRFGFREVTTRAAYIHKLEPLSDRAHL